MSNREKGIQPQQKTALRRAITLSAELLTITIAIGTAIEWLAAMG